MFSVLCSRLTQITDSVSGTVTRTYDNRFDTVATETVALGEGTSTTTYSYDVASRRTRIQVTVQTAVTFGYDDANRLPSVARRVWCHPFPQHCNTPTLGRTGAASGNASPSIDGQADPSDL